MVAPVDPDSADVPDSDPLEDSGSLDRDGLGPPDLSLRAHPLPLKCTAGAEMAFLIGAPHLGQWLGPWPWME